MKHRGQTLLAAIPCAAAIWISGVVAYSQTAPSVPNLIAYQGRVTLAGGSPVADGNYPAIFALYDNSTVGASLWTESASITTNGGTFTHNLGSVTALPAALTVANDSLWLAITFNGELLTPRTRVVGNAFSLTAGDLEMTGGSGAVALRTIAAGHQLSQYGSDGGEQVRLWGAAWGELYLDAAAVNASNDDVRLTSNNGNGGRLDLRKSGGGSGVSLHGGSAGAGATLALTNDAGLTTVFMDGDQTGDVAVQFPAASVSATEQFNEPGVAANIIGDTIVLSGPGEERLIYRTITAPSAGYVVAIGSLMLNATHTAGTTNEAQFWLRDSLNYVYGLFSEHFISASAPTGVYANSICLQSVFSVAAGLNGFMIQSYRASGSYSATALHLTLIFVPTAYGAVSTPSLAKSSTTNPLPSDTPADLELSRVERELREVRAQAEATTRRLVELEARMSSQPKPVDENGGIE